MCVDSFTPTKLHDLELEHNYVRTPRPFKLKLTKVLGLGSNKSVCVTTTHLCTHFPGWRAHLHRHTKTQLPNTEALKHDVLAVCLVHPHGQEKHRVFAAFV